MKWLTYAKKICLLKKDLGYLTGLRRFDLHIFIQLFYYTTLIHDSSFLNKSSQLERAQRTFLCICSKTILHFFK